jgi:phosphoglycerate dehydrogenase-like enzyme
MVASYGLAFGMNLLAHDLDPAAQAQAPSGVTFVDATDLLSSAQVLSLHLPLDNATSGWLSRHRIGMLPEGAWLVNTARGELIDEGALVEALSAGRLSGAALDVVADDSRWAGAVPPGQPILALAQRGGQVIVTPHIGGYASESVAATRRFVTKRFLHAVRAPGAAD